MWDEGEAYERFMGRWSRLLAARLVEDVIAGGAATGRWLDVGSGTGGVVEAALAQGVVHVDAVEPSPAFARGLEQRLAGRPVTVHHTDATSLPGGRHDVVISSLVLNFTPDPVAALVAMASAAPDGPAVVAVWDMTDPRSFLWHFWAAVEAHLGRPAKEDERTLWPQCAPDGLAAIARAAGWPDRVTRIEIPTSFSTPEDLWEPFLLGAGPVGMWLARQRQSDQDAIRTALVGAAEGPIELVSQALVISTGISTGIPTHSTQSRPRPGEPAR